jgi:predicted acylesterase/phospholipase RssA
MKRKWPSREESPSGGEIEMKPLCLGLVLGGGSVRGAAHVGVVSVLEREGIRPNVVAGTSVGALVGAGVAAGVLRPRCTRSSRRHGGGTWRRRRGDRA